MCACASLFVAAVRLVTAPSIVMFMCVVNKAVSWGNDKYANNIQQQYSTSIYFYFTHGVLQWNAKRTKRRKKKLLNQMYAPELSTSLMQLSVSQSWHTYTTTWRFAVHEAYMRAHTHTHRVADSVLRIADVVPAKLRKLYFSNCPDLATRDSSVSCFGLNFHVWLNYALIVFASTFRSCDPRRSCLTHAEYRKLKRSLCVCVCVLRHHLSVHEWSVSSLPFWSRATPSRHERSDQHRMARVCFSHDIKELAGTQKRQRRRRKK